MHPVFTQAIAAERTRELHAGATAAGIAQRLRRSRRRWLPMGIGRAGRGTPAMPLRGPRAA
jgi:hypothetical protein